MKMQNVLTAGFVTLLSAASAFAQEGGGPPAFLEAPTFWVQLQTDLEVSIYSVWDPMLSVASYLLDMLL